MADVKITKPPALKVTSLGNPTKSGNTFKEDWKIPADAKSGKKNNRFTRVYREWWVTEQTGNAKAKSTRVQKGNLNLSTTSNTYTIKPANYFPNTSKKLKSVTFKIWGGNPEGLGPKNDGTYSLKPPPKPTITKEVDADDGKVTFTIKASSSANAPKTNTVYWVGYRRYIEARPGQPEIKDTGYIWLKTSDNPPKDYFTFSGDQSVKTCNVNYATSLGPNDWIKVICKAKSRGIAGESAMNTPATNTDGSAVESSSCHIWAQPAEAVIKAIDVSGQTVIVKIDTKQTTNFHVVDKVQLQRATVDSGTTPIGSDFSDVSNAVDDGTCSGLTDSFSDAMPSESGKDVWYRIRSEHDNYKNIYSKPKKCEALTSEKLAADESSVLGLSIDTNISPGSVKVYCDFSKSVKNNVATSNALVYSYAILNEPATYASLEFSNETALIDSNMQIADKNGAYSTSWFINGLTQGSKYIIRVCRARCSDLTSTPPTIDSKGKWSYFTIADEENKGIVANLIDAKPFLVPSVDDILQEYLKTDSDVNITSVLTQESQTIKVTASWYRGEYSVLGHNNLKGSDKSVLEWITTESTSWDSMELFDNVDPDQEGLDQEGRHSHTFIIRQLSNDNKYRIRFKRVLSQQTGDQAIPSEDLSSEYFEWPTRVQPFSESSVIEEQDRCRVESVVSDLEKESMEVEISFTKDYGTNGTQILWSTKYPPKKLTTGSPSTFDVLDSDLPASSITPENYTEYYDPEYVPEPEDPTHHAGVFKLIIDSLIKGEPVYLDARRFIKTADSGNTSYSINYASGTRFSDPEFASSVEIVSTDDNAIIEELSASSDGKTITVTTSHFADDSDGTEISYSTRSDAWDTTKGPETYSLPDIKKGAEETRTISIPDLESGTRYYFRARRYLDGANSGENKTSYGPYSNPISEILTPYPVNQDVVYIDSISSEPDGTGLKLVLGWYDDASNKTEISYSDYKDAWISSSGANTFEVVDSDWLLEEPLETDTYDHKATAIIKDLDEGVKYYIRARRMKADDSHGVYTDTIEAVPLSSPDSIVLDVPSPVIIGQDFSISWGYQASGIQQQYTLKCNVAFIDSQTLAQSVTIDLSTEDQTVSYVGISWDAFYSKLNNLIFSEYGVEIGSITGLTFEVAITTGGDWVSSSVSTMLDSIPTCGVRLVADTRPLLTAEEMEESEETVNETINVVTAQPLSFHVFSDRADLVAIVRLISKGVSQQRPDGELQQPSGDCIWTEVLNGLSWSDTDPQADPAPLGPLEAIVSAPELNLIDNGSYILYVSLYDTSSGLMSNEVVSEFTVIWANQADAPSSFSRLDKIGTGPSIGIFLGTPANVHTGDVCDVYRKTRTGAQLIYESAEFGSTIVDDYPPYSMHINTVFDDMGDGIDLGYILATRTVDGDIDYLEFPYSLTRNGLSLDWDNGAKHLELPWNVDVSSTYSKDFENRVHMDGTVTGYWNSGSTLTGSLNTEICEIDCSDEEGSYKLDLCRQLATYAGPVFVRTPYGDAFCADVTVDISQNHNSPIATISLSYTAINFVTEFAANTVASS